MEEHKEDGSADGESEARVATGVAKALLAGDSHDVWGGEVGS
eukprot:CAMPEP_0170555314 /NCGR_PEP_ID=MMETSP0211-20121228/13221_1 /TAXON_ID=311385 /ORGANISM="Pseudokeronopsis sp., Strain OXSARD2" /LENGTH=41 /DNA_ID= /DNA_START= /DNA_END= /DNA_ORIENTATION=